MSHIYDSLWVQNEICTYAIGLMVIWVISQILTSLTLTIDYDLHADYMVRFIVYSNWANLTSGQECEPP